MGFAVSSTRFACLLTTVLATAVASAAAPTAQENFVPREIDVKGVMRDHFAGQKGYKSGDFLTRGMIEGALETLARKTHWELAAYDRKALLSLTVDDKSFLAKQLTSKAGIAFARHVASLPLGYDKLDRLSQLPQGRSTIERLVVGPDGHKLLEYMTTSRGGHDLSRMLSADGKGNFEKATGKIYDEQQLTAALTQVHKAAVARAKAAEAAEKSKRSGTVQPSPPKLRYGSTSIGPRDVVESDDQL